jgi:hypothetical protein
MINAGNFHLAAFYLSNLAQTADTAIPSVAEAVLAQNGNFFLLDTEWKLRKIYAQSTTLNRARLHVAAFAIPDYPQIVPVRRGSLPPDLPPICEWDDSGPILRPRMNWGFDATSDLGSGSEACVIGALIAPPSGLKPRPSGDVYTIRCTTSVTLTANAWTSNITITPVVQLPNDTFRVCGAYVVSTNGVLFRFIPRRGLLRPGGLCVTQFGNRPFLDQLASDFGTGGSPGLGEWFSFDNTALPFLEVFALSADTNPTVFLQVVRESSPFTPGISSAA